MADGRYRMPMRQSDGEGRDADAQAQLAACRHRREAPGQRGGRDILQAVGEGDGVVHGGFVAGRETAGKDLGLASDYSDRPRRGWPEQPGIGAPVPATAAALACLRCRPRSDP